MALVYGVQTYHVNINVGDATIVIKYSRPQNEQGPKVVESAVLIDGGKDGMGTWKPEHGIAALVSESFIISILVIEDEMHCQGTAPGGGLHGDRNRLLFDAIVVTHWDADHSDGIMSFIHGDIRLDGTRLYLSRAKYYDDNTPQTIFYAPYWKNFYPEIRAMEDSYWPYSRYAGLFMCSYDHDQDVPTDGFAYMHIILKDGSWGENMLRMRIGTEQLLGANFFHPDLPPQNLSNITSVKGLVDANSPGEPGSPGLYCVAVNRVVIGGQTALRRNADCAKSGDQISVQTTYKNQSSICNLIIWEDYTVSHYLAGDAHKELEEKIIDWIGWTEADDNGIVVAKLSHHGAWSSNPPSLFTKLKPQHVVISAGNNKGYGHPRWEILILMDAWWRYNVSNKRPGRVPLYLTQYPIYIGVPGFAGDYFVGLDPDAVKFLIEFTESTCRVKNPGVHVDQLTHLGKTLSTFYNTDKDTFLGTIYLYLRRTTLPSLCFPCYKLYPADKYVNAKDIVLYNAFEVEGINPHAGTSSTVLKTGYLTKLVNMYSDRFSSNEAETCTVDYDDWEIQGSSPVQRMLTPPSAAGIRNDEWCLVKTIHSSEPFYIIPANAKPPESGSGYGTVPKEHPLYNFLHWMPSERIALEHEVVKEQMIPLAASDEMQRWFRVMFGLATDSPSAQLSFYASSWPLKGSDQVNFQFTVEMPSGSSSGQQHVLSFDTTDANKLLGITQEDVGTMISAEKLLPFVVTFSPSQPSNSGWTLEEVATFINFDLPSAVKTILGNMKLEARPNNLDDPKKGARNALWYLGGLDHSTELRLEYTVATKDQIDTIDKWLKDANLKIVIKNAGIIAKKRTAVRDWQKDAPGIPVPIGNGGELTLTLDVELGGTPFDVFIQFRGINGITIRFQTQKKADESESMFQKLYDWLAATFNISKGDIQAEAWLKTAQNNKFLSGIKPRAFELSLSLNETGYPKSVDSVVLSLQIEPFVEEDQKEAIYFFTTFSWSPKKSAFMLAELWSSLSSSPVGYLKALPEWEPYRMLEPHPSADKVVLNDVDLKKLLKLDGLPAGVPSVVAEASLKIDGKGVFFATVIACRQPKGDESVPRLAIDRVEIQATKNWGKGFETVLRVDVMLFPGGKTMYDGIDLNARDDGARIIGAIEYNSTAKSWMLSAGVDNLTMSHLAGFVDRDSRDDALAVLGHLKIDYMHLDYSYVSGDEAGGSEFKFLGQISFSALRLAVEFSRTSGAQGNWTFLVNAGVNERFSKNGKTTVRLLLGKVFGGEDKIPSTVPSVVLDIELGRPGKPEEILTIKCSMVTVPGPKGKEKEEETKMLVMAGSVHFGNISLSFMQLRNSKWDKAMPSKRIVKVSVGKIGPLKAPLVGDIDIPIEQMMYLWVSAADPSAGKKESLDVIDANAQGKKMGLTKAEFTALSKQLEVPEDKIYFKSAKEPTKIGHDEIVLEAGSHFIIVAKNSKDELGAVLDYVFGRPNVKSKIPLTLVVTSQTEEELWVAECDNYDNKNHFGSMVAPGDDETPNTDVSKAPFKKSVGPLEVDNLGLKYDKDNERLGIVLDATFLLGPIGLSLLGFCFSVSLKDPKPKLLIYNERLAPNEESEISQQVLGLPIYAPEVSLSGLIVSFDKPPLTVAGGFFHAKEGKDEYYMGGLIITFKPWMIKAVGMYSEMHKDGSATSMLDDKDTFSSVFVIFKLEGPLFSVGFADISGLCGGLGVNSLVRTPTIETVLTFPFVDSGGVDKDATPLKTLKTLLKPPKGEEAWFVAREGSFWAAAGLKATAFQMLDVDAVIMIVLNPDVQLGIYGVAVCDVPSLRSDIKFAHAELGVACTLDIGSGTFKFEAQLSPRSYVLDKSCHLKGGIALFAWFQGTNANRQNEYEGDWVLSIGGYHAAFNRPSHYPNPPRLGISWTLAEGSISIKGEAYFAITPRVCMGGGRLHAALSAGPLGAWFDAALDFLINYDPFFFAATGSLSVGVRFTLDLWLVTIHISAEIGASLTVAGPPMAGIVHVDFWVFGFDIHFGGSMPNRPSPVSLDDFIRLALKAGGPNATQGVNFLNSSGGCYAADEDHDDWVAVEDDEKNCEKQVTIYANNTKPFLFNCTSGLTPTKTKAGNASLAHLEMLTVEEQDKVWSVSSGIFSFSITLGFAASEGKFYDKRANSPRDKNDPIPLPIPGEHKSGVFALPMNLISNINSKITITVEEKELPSAQHIAEDSKDQDWKIAPIIKSVPTSVWGKYDQAQDPALHGNGVGELLDGGKNGSIPLVMGFTLSAPPAHLSTPERPKFDLVKDTVLRVMTGKFKCKHDANSAWTPRNLWAPPRTSKEPDDEKKRKNEESWEEVPRVWQNPGNKPEDAVKLWAARLRIPENTLTGKPPARLLSRFEQMVPTLPMIAVGVACG